MTLKFTQPLIRFKHISIKNFYGVTNGEISFKGWPASSSDTDFSSDILGVYGPMGSGKTTVFNAIKVLKIILNPQLCFDWWLGNVASIQYGYDSATLKYTLDLKYSEDTRFEVTYSVDIFKVTSTTPVNEYYPYHFKCANEIISLCGTLNGETIKLQKIIDTTTTEYPFGPKLKLKEFLGVKNLGNKTKDIIQRLNVRKEFPTGSFIFGGGSTEVDYEKRTEESLLDILQQTAQDSFFYRVLRDFQSFHNNIIVVDAYDKNHCLGTYEEDNDFTFNTDKYNFLIFPQKVLDADNTVGGLDGINTINAYLAQISNVLEKILPNTQVRYMPAITKVSTADNPRYELMLLSNGNVVRYRDASAGTRKLITFIDSYVKAMTNPSITLLVDELDFRIYEMTLGEMIETFQEYGKGQLIFTAHNLRLLEILDKSSICLTTLDSANKYIKFSNLYTKINLRDLYLKAADSASGEVGKDNSRISTAFYEPIDPDDLYEACLKAGDELE